MMQLYVTHFSNRNVLLARDTYINQDSKNKLKTNDSKFFCCFFFGGGGGGFVFKLVFCGMHRTERNEFADFHNSVYSVKLVPFRSVPQNTNSAPLGQSTHHAISCLVCWINCYVGKYPDNLPNVHVTSILS